MKSSCKPGFSAELDIFPVFLACCGTDWGLILVVLFFEGAPVGGVAWKGVVVFEIHRTC